MSLLVANASVAGIGGDIRDIRGPLAISTKPDWGIYALLALAAALALAALVYWLRHRRTRLPSPYQEAKDRLRAANEGALSERSDQLAEQVSEAVRHYVEARFGVRASHRTTEEFLSELAVRDDVAAPLTSHRAELERFLGTCDLAKFAGRKLPADLSQDICRQALCFVEAAEQASLQGARA